MDIKRAAQLALDCQDGCNLSGILSTFKEVVHEVLWEEARKLGHGTKWVNQHPICFMFLYKLAALNGHEPLQTSWPKSPYSQAERACEAIAAGKPWPPEVDVCLAGAPAVNGVCGDADCVCAPSR